VGLTFSSVKGVFVLFEQTPVLLRMSTWINRWEAAADRRAIFLSCYSVMTRNMLESMESGIFQDSVWVYRLLEDFAEYYFRALESYENSHESLPPVWQITFNAARVPRVIPIQNLILGVNAHINYDLVLTLVDMLENEWDALSASQRSDRFKDHCAVNQIIAQSIDEVQDEVLGLYSPSMNLIDQVFGRLDEWMISSMITRWREQVWQQAVRCIEASSPADKNYFIQQVENASLQKAQWILMNWRKQDFEKAL
jgi:hypothetical protein